MHIAMWSGPRNLSTAMMYSFGARADFEVLDEPFYGAYLTLNGLDHPMRDEIIASMDCDPSRVAKTLSVKPTQYLYSKQMTHHMIDGIPRDWLSAARHVFLLRHPNRVVASYDAKRENPTVDDLGFIQQVEVFNTVKDFGPLPIVIDSFDIRKDPEGKLRALCDALGISWDPAMLSWPSGGHPSDGVWAAHWYSAVHRSTGFTGPEGELPILEPQLQVVADTALPHYEAMAAHKI